ncbi:hypothetical protein K501DRAFT_266411 [Backusella circina FSU 941]|nr:hypothetical protein K501DRAFT_266411 [Backusella circina FSU 941]
MNDYNRILSIIVTIVDWNIEKIEVDITFTISYIVECISILVIRLLGCYEIRSPKGKVGCGTQRMNSRGVLACASDSFHRPAGLTNNKEDEVGLIILGLAPISASRMKAVGGEVGGVNWNARVGGSFSHVKLLTLCGAVEKSCFCSSSRPVLHEMCLRVRLGSFGFVDGVFSPNVNYAELKLCWLVNLSVYREQSDAEGMWNPSGGFPCEVGGSFLSHRTGSI